MERDSKGGAIFLSQKYREPGREKFPTGNLFVTESLTLRFDKIGIS